MDQIVNAHSHLIEMEGMYRKYGNISLPPGIPVLADLKETLRLLDPQALIGQMDEAGVAKSVLYAVEAPIVYSSNEYVSHICEQFPERFIGFASVDPLSANAPEILTHAVRNLNLKGLKLHPPLQDFFPNSEQAFPTYERAAELNIPVVFHAGTTPFGSLCRLDRANPILIDDVATRFPSLRIMITHLGTLWHDEAFMVVEKNPNVFIDTAAYLYEIGELLTPNLISRIGMDKVIFGTDFPMPYAGKPHRIRDFVDEIRKLALPPEMERAIFWDNCFRLIEGPVGNGAPGPTLEDLMSKMGHTLS